MKGREMQRAIAKAKAQARFARVMAPKLTASQVRDLSLVHHVQLDAIASGQGTYENLVQWTGGVFTWSRVADLLGRHQSAMGEQLALATRLLERYRQTQQARFEPGEYDVARRGVMVMDALARTVDLPTAVAAAEWSEARLATIDGQAMER